MTIVLRFLLFSKGQIENQGMLPWKNTVQGSDTTRPPWKTAAGQQKNNSPNEFAKAVNHCCGKQKIEAGFNAASNVLEIVF